MCKFKDVMFCVLLINIVWLILCCVQYIFEESDINLHMIIHYFSRIIGDLICILTLYFIQRKKKNAR